MYDLVYDIEEYEAIQEMNEMRSYEINERYAVTINPVPVEFQDNGDPIIRKDETGWPKQIVIEAATYVTVDEQGTRRKLSFNTRHM